MNRYYQDYNSLASARDFVRVEYLLLDQYYLRLERSDKDKQTPQFYRVCIDLVYKNDSQSGTFNLYFFWNHFNYVKITTTPYKGHKEDAEMLLNKNTCDFNT